MTEDLQAFLDIEKQWKDAQTSTGYSAVGSNTNNSSKRGDIPPPPPPTALFSSEDTMLTLVDSWAQLLADLCPAYGATATSLTHNFALHPLSSIPDPLTGDSCKQQPLFNRLVK